MWPIFLCAWLIHTIYKWFQAEAYSRGAYTVVYPIVRGTSPILTIFIAGILFGEKFSIIQWVGVLTMCIGIFGIALYNLFKTSVDRDILKMATEVSTNKTKVVQLYMTPTGRILIQNIYSK